MTTSAYCNTCLSSVPLEKGKCTNCGNSDCPAPYRFTVYSSETEAKTEYEKKASWLPKFYFQAVDKDGKHIPDLWCVAWHDAPAESPAVEVISSLINEDAIKLIEAGLSLMLNGAVAILEPTGVRIEKDTEGIPFLTCDYCKLIRSTSFQGCNGNHLCKKFDFSIQDSLKAGKVPSNLVSQRVTQHRGHELRAFAYICWAGLIDYACPIVIQGKLIATIFAGQKRLLRGGIIEDTVFSIAEQNKNCVRQQLGLSEQPLENLLKDVPCILTEEDLSLGFENILKAAQLLIDIAYERYLRRREEKEHYFRREIQHRIAAERESRYGVKLVDIPLKRLTEFLKLEEAYFLLNDIDDVNCFHIFGKASSTKLVKAEHDFKIIFSTDKLAIRDRISIFELTGKEKYKSVLDSISTQLPHLTFNRVYLGTCPLEGATNGFWLFINPCAVPGVRNDKALDDLDRNFLSRFCASSRDSLKSALATSIVMRKVSHELGAKLWQISARENEIAHLAQGTGKIHIAANRNISQLRRYQSVLDNLRNVFLRRSKESYDFVLEHINPLIKKLVASFEGDTDMETRHVTFLLTELTPHDRIPMEEKLLPMALYNLLENAVKYSFNDKYVEVRSHEGKYMSKTGYYLDLVNYGFGILQEEIDGRLIFLEDYRGALARSEKHITGSGLGLALADTIIANHSGHISVKSIAASQLTTRRSEYCGVVQDASYFAKVATEAPCGYLNRFSVFLPYQTKL